MEPFIRRTTPFVPLSRRPSHRTASPRAKPTARLRLALSSFTVFTSLIRHFFLTERDFSPVQSHSNSLSLAYVFTLGPFIKVPFRFVHSLRSFTREKMSSLATLTHSVRSLTSRAYALSLALSLIVYLSLLEKSDSPPRSPPFPEGSHFIFRSPNNNKLYFPHLRLSSLYII